MEADWNKNVYAFCQQRIFNRYPLNLGLPAARDVTLDDFTEMFAKGQRIDVFVLKYLDLYLDTGANPWRWKPEAQSLNFNSQVPPILQYSAEIRDSFFGTGGSALGVVFTVRSTGGERKGSKLEIAADVMPLEPGATPKNYAWPSGAGRGARVSSDFNEQVFDGQWAFLRLMNASSPAGTGSDWRLRLSNDATVQLEFRNSKNPLTVRPVLGRFLCVPFLQ
jgi:type VI secretion system protein ImpL